MYLSIGAPSLMREKVIFTYPTRIWRPHWGRVIPSECYQDLWHQKISVPDRLLCGTVCVNLFSHSGTILACDGQTDRQTDRSTPGYNTYRTYLLTEKCNWTNRRRQVGGWCHRWGGWSCRQHSMNSAVLDLAAETSRLPTAYCHSCQRRSPQPLQNIYTSLANNTWNKHLQPKRPVCHLNSK